jgi:predicted  nucleic acid-binding Zn-ribbon protein
MPAPPRRQSIVAPVAAAELSPEAKQEIDRLHRRFSSVESDAQLSDVYEAIGDIDIAFAQLPLEIEDLRARGYAHSRQAEAQVDAFRNQWDGLRPRVENALTEQVGRLGGDLQQAMQRVQLISVGTPQVLAAATTAVDSLESKVRAADRAVSGLYSNLNDEVQKLIRELEQIKKMLDQLDQSPDIHLRDAEGPIAMVEAQWQRDGNDGPEGNLFLTDQRLLFERKEEVVTRRVLGIFKADSEKHQELLLDIEIGDIEKVGQRQESSGFLGLGRSEFMELTLGANAPLSRARILLKQGQAADWVSKIKRVQTGDINRDRHEAYVEELEAADGVLFPTQCSSCFAAVPPAPRGARTMTCEFCGATINPIQ